MKIKPNAGNARNVNPTQIQKQLYIYLPWPPLTDYHWTNMYKYITTCTILVIIINLAKIGRQHLNSTGSYEFIGPAVQTCLYIVAAELGWNWNHEFMNCPESAMRCQVGNKLTDTVRVVRHLKFYRINQWIGLRENLQENPIFTRKICGFLWNFP
jgi:hypothetical protein